MLWFIFINHVCYNRFHYLDPSPLQDGDSALHYAVDAVRAEANDAAKAEKAVEVCKALLEGGVGVDAVNRVCQCVCVCVCVCVHVCVWCLYVCGVGYQLRSPLSSLSCTCHLLLYETTDNRRYGSRSLSVHALPLAFSSTSQVTILLL